MTATTRPFGTLADDTVIEAVDLEGDGISATVITLGAALAGLRAPDRAGRMGEVVLGFADLEEKARRPGVSGASVGRYANRIGDAGFEMDGTRYALKANNGPHCLHGGPDGFHTRTWRLAHTGTAPHPFATFALVSPDGDGGFPGQLEVTATYALTGTHLRGTDRPADGCQPDQPRLLQPAQQGPDPGSPDRGRRRCLSAGRFPAPAHRRDPRRRRHTVRSAHPDPLRRRGPRRDRPGNPGCARLRPLLRSRPGADHRAPFRRARRGGHVRARA